MVKINIYLKLKKLLCILRNEELKIISGGLEFSEIKSVFLLLLNKYEKIFMQKQEIIEQAPMIGTKLNLKVELPIKKVNTMNPIDLSRYCSQNQNQNFIKPPVNATFNENKSNAVNYKNFSVAAFNSMNGIQSKHYNYPKSTSSILTVGQYNYIRYPSNNNI